MALVFKVKFYTFFFTLVLSFGLSSQSLNPGEDQVFRENEVTEIHVALAEADKDFLLASANRFSGTYVTADVTFNNSALQNVTLRNVGVRLRGNTSREHLKKSFKIDFQEFGGDKFLTHKKINLKPNVNDPSHVRELLTMKLYRQMDVPAPRVAPSALYFNEEFMGVYLMVEQIDDEFVDKRYGHEEGFLYKCSFGATLEDNSRIMDESLYESKMNEESDTRTELQSFVNILNSTSKEDFREEVQQVFQVDRFIRQLVVEAITGHWDGYSYNSNNYYLFYNERYGKFEFIAYDTDNTWGIDWVNRDWATRDLNHFHRHGVARPLTSRILDVPEFRNRYHACLNKVFQLYFTQQELYPVLGSLENVLEPYVSVDEKFDVSFGFSQDDFSASFNYYDEAHVEYGLREFIQVRRSSGMASVPEVDMGFCNFEDVSVYPNPSSDGQFRIVSKENLNPQINVFDMFGKLVPHIRISDVETPEIIEIPKPGNYLIQVDKDVFRVIVE